MLHAYLSWIHSTYGNEVEIPQNGLRASTRGSAGSYWADLKAATAWTTVGWQMYLSGASDGDLKTAFEIGLAANTSYFQVYAQDVDSTSKSTMGASQYLPTPVARSSRPSDSVPLKPWQPRAGHIPALCSQPTE